MGDSISGFFCHVEAGCRTRDQCCNASRELAVSPYRMSEPNGGKGQSDVPGLRVDGEVCGKCRFVSIKAAACLPAANGGDFFKSTGQPTAIAGDEGKIMNLSGLGSCWFAIQVRPKYEDLTSALLQQKGYEGFVPRLAYTRPSAGLEAGGRNRHRRLLYPGYIFCRFDPVIAAQ